MGSLSNFAENEFLDHLLGITAWTTPATVYCGLFTTDPTDAGSGTEVTVADGYIRKACSFGSAASRVITQDAIIQYDEATGTWGTISHWGLFDAESGGNLLAHGAFASPAGVVSGNTPSIGSTEIFITVSAGGCSDYLANAMLDHIFNSTTFTQPSIYIALCEAAISDSQTGSTIDEMDMTGYARESKDGTTHWDTAVGDGVTANKTLIDFGSLTGISETLEAICICDNGSTGAGNLLIYDNTISQAIGVGDSVQIPIGDFDISLA